MTEAIKNSVESSTQIGGLAGLSAASGEESLFCRRIEFHLARKPFTGFSNGNGDFRLETLNPSSQKPGANQVNGPLPLAKKISDENGLDPELSFEMTFRKIVRIGAGLENLGNTCFLNSVLQCLTYTEPLAAYLQSGKHQVSCRTSGFCALCAIQRHVSRALQSTGRSLSPKELVSNLRCISRNFRNSRQEDAHEYMVNFLEAMHKCCLPAGVPSGSQSAYQKSLIHKIFGGHLRSQVKCMQCNHCSDTFDPFLDLSLEINKADSVYKALANFTAKEQLDGGERHYQCERCKQKVRALKQLTIHKAPDVLIVHLKRFGSHQGQKIDKKIVFAPNLDLKPFVTGSYDGDMKYNLFGVLVHAGWSTHSGHYFSFVRTSSGMWYNLDDNRVVQVSEKRVLEQKAYMLFYTRERKYFAPKKPIQILPKENMTAINGSIEKKNLPVTNISQAIIKKTTTLLNVPVKIQSNSSVLITQLDSSKESAIESVSKSDNKGLNGHESVRHLDEGRIVNVVPISSNGNASLNTITEKTLNETGKPCPEKHYIDLNIQQSNCSGLHKSATDVYLENGLKASHPYVFVKDSEKVEPSCQIEDIIKRNLSSDLMKEKADGKEQKSADSVSETVQISTQKSYKNDPDIKPNQMRIKKHCARTTMHLSASILFASSLKHKTKKNKRTRKSKLVLNTMRQESDLGPSTSEKISPTIKRKTGFNSKKENNVVKNADVANRNGVLETVNEQFSGGNCQTADVLDAVDVKRQKICSNGEVNDLKDEINNSKQNGLLNLLTRGVDDTIVKGWDEMESYPLIMKNKSNGVKNLTIGYIGDEWDEEYDRGKRKKIRGMKNSFGGPNPFQEIATSKANFKKAKLDHASSENLPFRIK